MGDRAKGYLWAELGALAGAVIAGIPAVVAGGAAIGPVIMEVDGWYLVLVIGLVLGAIGVGSAFGCRFALRRKALDLPDRTAFLLAVLLGALYLVALWSSDTWLQSDLLPYLGIAAPFMPLVARWLARAGSRRPSS
jgi:hypothetical protein